MNLSNFSSTSNQNDLENVVSWEPPELKELKETGLETGYLSDMVLKILYYEGEVTGHFIAERLGLPFENIVSLAVDFLKRERMCEVKGTGGVGTGGYRYLITDKGTKRAREQLERTTYTGLAPVPWADYVKAIRSQSQRRIQVTRGMMSHILSDMVLDEPTFDKIGPAINSGKSIFLYGPPGNGKSTIAENIGRAVLGKEMYIPYAVEIDGQIIVIYDELNHQWVDEAADNPYLSHLTNMTRKDKRWLRIKRPCIMVGGELTLEGLELRYDYNNKFYEAPYQMKANGGMLLIDDFGRQRVPPQALLNRWIVPMEKRVDFLALHTGRKLEMPFELLVVFSTNLPPRELVDEAFLRRIRHKIEIKSPNFRNYWRIFNRVAEANNLSVDEDAVKHLFQTHYVEKERPLRANHPRDLIEQIIDIAAYLRVEPQVNRELIDIAAESYFVDL